MPAALETLPLSRPVLAVVVKRDLCAVGEAGSAGPPEALAHGRHETNRPSLPVLALALASAPDSATVADTTRILGRGRLSARLSRRTTLPLFVSPRPLDSVGRATPGLSPVPVSYTQLTLPPDCRVSARLARRTTLPLFVSPRPLDSGGCATTALSPV